MRSFPRRNAPGFCPSSARNREGAGNAGCLAAPAAPCAKVESTRVVTTGTPLTRHSLHNGFTAYLVLSSVNRALLPPSLRKSRLAKLDSSVGESGPHDFAIRIGALRQSSPTRPSHPAANVRDDAYAPHCERGMRANNHIFLKNGSYIFGDLQCRTRSH